MDGQQHWDGEHWERGREDLGKRIRIDDVEQRDLLERLQGKQAITIEEGTRALLFREGELVQDLDAGRHTLDSYWKQLKDLRRHREAFVVLADTRTKQMGLAFDDIRTESDFDFAAYLELDIALDDTEHFYKSMMQERDAVSLSDLREMLAGPIRNVLESTVHEYSYDRIYGNKELHDQIQEDIRERAAEILDENGIGLVRLRFFDYEDTLEDVREKRREEKKEVMKERAEVEADEAREELRDSRSEMRQEKLERIKDEKTTQEAARRQLQREQQQTSREAKEHDEELRTIQKQGEIEREDMEFDQDMTEMEKLLEIKRKKDEQKLQRKKEEHDLEKDKIASREDADAETLASLEDTDEDMTELAKMEKAKKLSPEQLDSLGAQDSDELAKARQEAASQEMERRRVKDQKEAMDRMESVMERALDDMGRTAASASEDVSDNVIVSDGHKQETVVNEKDSSDETR